MHVKDVFLTFFPFLDSSLRSGALDPVLNFENTKDFLFVAPVHSAKKLVYLETISLVLVLLWALGLLVSALAALFGVSVFVAISGLVAVFYMVLLGFKRLVVFQGRSFPLVDFSQKQLMDLNNIKNPRQLRSGQKLKVPPAP